MKNFSCDPNKDFLEVVPRALHLYTASLYGIPHAHSAKQSNRINVARKKLNEIETD